MENLWIYLPFLIPAVVAQFAEKKNWARITTYGMLIAINLGLLGIVGMSLLNQFAKMAMPETLEPAALAANWISVAAVCLLTCVLAFVPLIPQARQRLSQWMNIEPASLVHMTALAFAIYQIGLNLGQMALIGDLENLIDSELALTVWDVVLSGIPMLLFALVGVGLFTRRDLGGTLDRLGLHLPTWKQVATAIGVTVLLLAVNLLIDSLWETLDPAGYGSVNRVTEALFGNLTTVGGGLVLGLSAGISEELLFRGAVQPRLGILLTTVLFAVGHLQYGFSVAMLQVFVIGLVLGVVRKRANTTITIAIHAGYNMLIVFLGLLQT